MTRRASPTLSARSTPSAQSECCRARSAGPLEALRRVLESDIRILSFLDVVHQAFVFNIDLPSLRSTTVEAYFVQTSISKRWAFPCRGCSGSAEAGDLRDSRKVRRRHRQHSSSPLLFRPMPPCSFPLLIRCAPLQTSPSPSYSAAPPAFRMRCVRTGTCRRSSNFCSWLGCEQRRTVKMPRSRYRSAAKPRVSVVVGGVRVSRPCSGAHSQLTRRHFLCWSTVNGGSCCWRPK